MATTTVSTTDIELDHRSSEGATVGVQSAPALQSTNQEDVTEASRVFDAAVPEGGYEAWTVIGACGVLCYWFVGTTYSWGVIQGALVADGLSSASTLSWIGSLAIACNAILAISSARLLRSLGSRLTAFCGMGFFAAGELLASFSVHNVGGLFVTAGLIM